MDLSIERVVRLGKQISEALDQVTHCVASTSKLLLTWLLDPSPPNLHRI